MAEVQHRNEDRCGLSCNQGCLKVFVKTGCAFELNSSDFFPLPLLFSDGYAFSQEEHGVVSQSEVVRSYDTTKRRTEIE